MALVQSEEEELAAGNHLGFFIYTIERGVASVDHRKLARSRLRSAGRGPGCPFAAAETLAGGPGAASGSSVYEFAAACPSLVLASPAPRLAWWAVPCLVVRLVGRRGASCGVDGLCPVPVQFRCGAGCGAEAWVHRAGSGKLWYKIGDCSQCCKKPRCCCKERKRRAHGKPTTKQKKHELFTIDAPSGG